MINILYIPTLNIPVYYWRIENYASQLVNFKERCAVHVVYLTKMEDNIAWDKICLGFGEQSDRIQHALQSAFSFYDVIVFQKIQNKEALALLEKYQERFPKVKVVAEIDDAIGEIPPSNIYYDKFKDEHKWAAQHVRMSDAVIVSTKYLGESIKKILDKEVPIHVAPNCIDSNTWKFNKSGKKRSNKELRIGYVAGAGHDEDLLIAYRAMIKIMGKYPEVKFVIRYGGLRPLYLRRHGQLDFERVCWHISEYSQKISNLNLDLALAPLRDTEFNRCKSNLRWIEFASMGTPLVASDVEPFANTKGFMYKSTNDIEDYFNAIEKAILDHKNKRTRFMNKNLLKKECAENYNLEKETEGVLTFFENLCNI